MQILHFDVYPLHRAVSGNKSLGEATILNLDTARDESAASSYFRRVEPDVVFGTIDTKVPNRKRNDGLPKYDVPVEGITSPGKGGLTFRNVVWDQAPFAMHAAFIDAVTSTVNAFVDAGMLAAPLDSKPFQACSI